ncbi:hypothetical protein BH23CHL5_BH23CHL5_27420 [soil metagenome]
MEITEKRLMARSKGFVRRTGIVVTLAILIAAGAAGGALLGSGLIPSGAVAQSAATTELSVAYVAEVANPAVVTITTMQDFSQVGGEQGSFPGLPGEEQFVPVGSGSGFIIDTDGHVVTNNHVVAGGVAFEVTYFDGRTAAATLVGRDSFQDVAVIKIDLVAGDSVPGVVMFGNSDDVTAGIPVVAIGTPYGEYANTVTSGMVNAIDRGLNSGGGYSLPNLIQHDAAIYPGNSGGPLLNGQGEVIGINVAKAYVGEMGGMQSESFNFAIEGNAAEDIVRELIASGTYERAYLGITGQAVSGGVEIVSIEASGPAEAAGLQELDVIVGIVGLDGNNPNQALDVILFEKRPGEAVTLEIFRNGELIELVIVLGTRPAEFIS